MPWPLHLDDYGGTDTPKTGKDLSIQLYNPLMYFIQRWNFWMQPLPLPPKDSEVATFQEKNGACWEKSFEPNIHVPSGNGNEKGKQAIEREFALPFPTELGERQSAKPKAGIWSSWGMWMELNLCLGESADRERERVRSPRESCSRGESECWHSYPKREWCRSAKLPSHHHLSFYDRFYKNTRASET